MHPLARFEALMERLLEGSIARLLRPRIQPVVIAKRLVRAMEDGQRISVGKVLVPNRYVARLNPDDFASLASDRPVVERELAEHLIATAQQHGWTSLGRPIVQILADSAVPRSTIAVDARLEDVADQPVADAALAGQTTRLKLDLPPVPKPPKAWLLVESPDGEVRVPLQRLPVALGRAFDNDVVLEDRRVSRHHAQVKLLQGQYCIVDLESTNGTSVNGKRVNQAPLHSGDVISLGGVRMVFRVEEP